MSDKAEEVLAALRECKCTILEAALAASLATGHDVSFDGTSDWVHWGQMTNKEKQDYPHAEQDGGFYRVGVRVTGALSI